MLIGEEELAERRHALEAAGGYRYPPSQTPWQALQRTDEGQLGAGGVLESAIRFQRVSETMGLPRDNH